MLSRVVVAVVIGVVVTLACVLIGSVLVSLKVDVAVTVGDFLRSYSGVIGVLAAIWHFFSGTEWPRVR